MTIDEIIQKKVELESQIFKLLRDFQGESVLLIRSVYIETIRVSCGEVIGGIKTEIIL